MTRTLLLSLLLPACTKGDDEPEPYRPDPICNEAAVYDDGGSFSERTNQMGLEGVTGTRFGAVDLDGDGWTDLVVSEGSNYGRDDFTDPEAQRYHWVLMNRDEGDGSRVFVDETVQSGLFAARGEDPAEVGRAGMVHVFADVDGDGDVDAFSGQFYDANNPDLDPGDRSELMLNNGDGTFEMADKQPFWIDEGYTTSGASFTDVDGDGDVDLWMVGWYEQYGLAYGEQDRL